MPRWPRCYSPSCNEFELQRVPRIAMDRQKRSELPPSTWPLMRQNIVSITDQESRERLTSLKIETIERVCTMSSGSSKVECDPGALWRSVDAASKPLRCSKPPFGSNVPGNEQLVEQVMKHLAMKGQELEIIPACQSDRFVLMIRQIERIGCFLMNVGSNAVSIRRQKSRAFENRDYAQSQLRRRKLTDQQSPT